MGEVGSLAALSQATSGLSSAANGYAQYQAHNAQGRAARNTANVNAQMADLQAADAIRRGGETASLLAERGKQVEGEQRVGIAAGNVDVNSGTAAQLQDETRTLSLLDQLRAKNNAALEALGYKMNSTNLNAQGGLARIAGRVEGGNSLLSGGMAFARDTMMAGAIYDKYKIRVPVAAIPKLDNPDWKLPKQPQDPGMDEVSGGYDPGMNEAE